VRDQNAITLSIRDAVNHQASRSPWRLCADSVRAWWTRGSAKFVMRWFRAPTTRRTAECLEVGVINMPHQAMQVFIGAW